MSPKNAIKMIIIQKSYLVNVGHILSILSSLIHFSSIIFTSVLVGPHWSYFVHFSPIQSTLVLFGPFYQPRSYSVHNVHFGPNLSICSYSVYIGPLYPIRSTLYLFSPILSIRSTSFHNNKERAIYT